MQTLSPPNHQEPQISQVILENSLNIQVHEEQIGDIIEIWNFVQQFKTLFFFKAQNLEGFNRKFLNLKDQQFQDIVDCFCVFFIKELNYNSSIEIQEQNDLIQILKRIHEEQNKIQISYFWREISIYMMNHFSYDNDKTKSILIKEEIEIDLIKRIKILKLLINIAYETESLRKTIDNKIESVEQNQKLKQEHLLDLANQNQLVEIENKNLRQFMREINIQQKKLEASQSQGNRMLSTKINRLLIQVKMKKNYQEQKLQKLENKILILKQKLFNLRGNLNHSINSSIVLGNYDKYTQFLYFQHDNNKIYVKFCKKNKEQWQQITDLGKFNKILQTISDKNALQQKLKKSLTNIIFEDKGVVFQNEEEQQKENQEQEEEKLKEQQQQQQRDEQEVKNYLDIQEIKKNLQKSESKFCHFLFLRNSRYGCQETRKLINEQIQSISQYNQLKQLLLDLNRLFSKVENLQRFEELDLNKCSKEYENFTGSEQNVLQLETLCDDDLFIKRVQLGLWGVQQTGKEKKEEYINLVENGNEKELYLASQYLCMTVKQYVRRKMELYKKSKGALSTRDPIRKKLKKNENTQIGLDCLDDYQYKGFNLRNRVKINFKEESVNNSFIIEYSYNQDSEEIKTESQISEEYNLQDDCDQSMKLLVCQICDLSEGEVFQCQSCYLYLHKDCADINIENMMCMKCQIQIQSQPTTRSNRRKLMILD